MCPEAIHSESFQLVGHKSIQPGLGTRGRVCSRVGHGHSHVTYVREHSRRALLALHVGGSGEACTVTAGSAAFSPGALGPTHRQTFTWRARAKYVAGNQKLFGIPPEAWAAAAGEDSNHIIRPY